MKKFLCVCLALCVCLSIAASAEYSLIHVEKPESLNGLQVCSLSPDGRRMLCINSEDKQVYIVSRDGNTRIAVWPDYENSVEDIYGNLETMYETLPMRIKSINAGNWSPDGHYIAITNWRLTMLNGRYDNDLIVIDTQTGAMRDYQTYANSSREENFSTVITTRFAHDSRMLYYISYSRSAPGGTILMRLDMETGECENIKPIGTTRGTVTTSCDLPDLCITPDGVVAALIDGRNRNALLGIRTVEENLLGWRIREKNLPKSVETTGNVLTPWRLYMSPETGLGLILFTFNGQFGALSAFDGRADFENFDRFIDIKDIPENGNIQAERIGIEEWIAHIDRDASDTDLTTTLTNLTARVYGIARVTCCALSPDGTKAMLIVNYQKDKESQLVSALLLMDTQTLACERIHTPDALDLNNLRIIYKDADVIQWNINNCALVLTEEGFYDFYIIAETDGEIKN